MNALELLDIFIYIDNIAFDEDAWFDELVLCAEEQGYFEITLQ